MGSRILLISVLLMVKLCLVQPLALVKRIVSALLLPPAVPAASSSSPANSEGASKLVTKRVAIIGGGIAGHGCAFALGRTDGAFQVDLFEAREDFGGNAKIFEWPDKQKTGLSVLAWPPEYFHNYEALLAFLGIKTTSVKLPFFIKGLDGQYFAHGQDLGLSAKFKGDISKWSRMVEIVRAVNEFFSPADTRDDGGKETRVKSMYYLSLLNPMNVIPLRMLSRLYMISAAFWEEVVVPIYASSFLTVRLDAVPSVILPMVSDIIPLAGIPSLTSWQQNSGCVFDEMTSKGNFKRFGGHVVSRVFKAASDDARSVSSASSSPSLSSRPGTSPAKWAVVTSKGTFKGYDLVVFATNSHHAAATRVNSRETKNKEHGSGKTVFGRLLHSIQECWDCIRSAWSGEMPLLDALILNGIEYTDERDDTFVEGVIHSDPSVLPPQHREEMMQSYANFIESRSEPTGLKYQNTFIISSWYPSAVASSASKNVALPRLVTYGAKNVELIRQKHGVVENVRNHPHLQFSSLILATCMRFIQGENDVYYCGSFATPGNGHDLSLCSGFAVATAMGADYPLEKGSRAHADFLRMKGNIMGL